MEAECRYCFHLVPHPDHSEHMKDDNGMPTWRCPFGRFDVQKQDGTYKRWFAWLVIWLQLDNVIAKAQAGCLRFQVHPRAGEFTETRRVMP